MFRHGATYAGHPSVCAAALAMIDIYEREDADPPRPDLEQPLHDALAPLAGHPAVGRGPRRARLPGRGRRRRPDADAGAAARLAAGARKAGVLVRPLLGGVAVSPPLICEQEHIDLLAQAIDGRTGRCSPPAEVLDTLARARIRARRRHGDPRSCRRARRGGTANGGGAISR